MTLPVKHWRRGILACHWLENPLLAVALLLPLEAVSPNRRTANCLERGGFEDGARKGTGRKGDVPTVALSPHVN